MPRALALLLLLPLAACDMSTNAPPSGGATTDAALIDDGNRSYVASPEGIDVTNRLPICFVRGTTSGLDVVEDYGKNKIVGGGVRVPRNALADNTFDRNRRVEKIGLTPDVVIVMVNVSRAAGGKAYPNILDGATASPVLVDTLGTKYSPIGFAFLDQSWAEVRYDPGVPLEKAADLPATSRSRPDQHLWLIYRVSFGRSLARAESDNGQRLDFASPIVLNVAQGD